MAITTIYKIRLNFIFLVFLFLYFVVWVHLYIIQIYKKDFFQSLAQNQYPPHTLYLPRAPILDRNGQPLALNIAKPSAFMFPTQLTQPHLVQDFLKRFFPLAAQKFDLMLKQHNQTNFMYIKRHLTPQEVELIETSGLNDIHIIKEPHRFYCLESAGPVVGITDVDNTGISGIEKMYNTSLINEPVMLTLDSTLQFLAYEEAQEAVQKHQATEAAVLILDPLEGDILAMAHYPAFNPNDNVTFLDMEKAKNKIVTETYELGSVIKTFLALAALDEGVTSSDEVIDCHNALSARVSGLKINTLKPHGLITFSEIIELSNNIGTSIVAQRLGPNLHKHYVRCGFGQKTGLDFLGEQKGYLNPPEHWSRRSVFSLSFGYELRATLLQLARAFSVIATNGYLVTPRLVLKPASPQKTIPKRLYKRESIQKVREILQKTITQGTAHKAHISGYTIMGKTGTACLLIDGVYHLYRNIFTFTGIIEKDSYKRLIVTFIKESSNKLATASSTAAPLFEKIAHKMLIHDKII